MFPRIAAVHHLGEYRLRLVFTSGEEAELDLRPRIVGRGGVFRPLEDIAFFAQVKIDPEARTLAWPKGVDLDPDVLYSEAMGVPLPVPQLP